jgi:2-oxoglutarate ferredoxin oxidoreductase subunit beta
LLPGVFSLERTSLHSPQEILKTKRAIKQAFVHQLENKGFSLVEVLSPCPTYLGLTPRQALDWIKDVMVREFPLGRIK